MSRRDQYGTHDDHHAPYRERRTRSGERSQPAAPDVERGRRGPDYGNHTERAVRTSAGSQAEFQGRDYERENYGSGYGNQRKTRDVPAAGRKGDWMHASRVDQMSATDPDASYRRWRDAELSRHDEDYRAWRRREQDRHDQDYADWKAGRGHRKGRP